ncbi:MAG TPA: phosphoglucosamine mutase [Opitutaceae bacterium]|nr:phosphoglucosamine mutase [Opitutaceae bacterium]
MKRVYFGTDGVRGIYGGPVMNEVFATRLGIAAARWLRSTGEAGACKVFIGRDSRQSGRALEIALATGLIQEGCVPVSLDVVPTPAVSLAVRSTDAVLGVVITASHNPAEDNGIKFFGQHGIKLTDAEEFTIEQLLPVEAPEASEPAKLDEFDAQTHYIEAARQILPACSLKGWRIAVDAANGASVGTTRSVLEELGANLILLGHEPNGRNINLGVGSQHPEKLCEAVRKSGARLGVAHDGDADRCILCDEHAVVLDGDEILTILALDGIARKSLSGGILVVTQQSNLGVDAAIRAAGGRVERTDVGDRYVIERMLAVGASLGGESSGHVISADVAPTGDGLVAALKVIGVMLRTGLPLSTLRKGLKKYPQATGDLMVNEKRDLKTMPHYQAALAALNAELGTHGRVMVRYSGTEPKLRFLVEGPDGGQVNRGIALLRAAACLDLDLKG